MPAKNTRQARDKTTDSSWNLKEIQDLIDLLIQKEVSEFELERAGVKIRIRRGNSRAESWATGTLSEPALEPLAPSIESRKGEEPSSVHSAVAEPRAPESAEGLHIIKSPIVGTYYEAPAPNAPPFVKLGDTVEIGKVLCIIEAMKLMNEIESEVGGEIVRIYVENGQPVEYGQSLFAIKPSPKR
jgi:acetyl-CoA carboxylase biotin carboxyl carrier protein